LNRLSTPFLRGEGGFERISWRRAHLVVLRQWLRNLLVTDFVPELNFAYGHITDLETLFVSSFFQMRFFSPYFNDAPLSSLRFTSALDLKSVKVIFLSCFNPRYEAPMLNLGLRRLVRIKALSVFSFGAEHDLTYHHFNLGFSMCNLLSFLSFKHPVFRLLKHTSDWFFIVGFSSFFTSFRERVLLAYDIFFSRLSYHLFGVNYVFLTSYLNEVSQREFFPVSFGRDSCLSFGIPQWLYFLGDVNSHIDLNIYSLIIYQGSHGSKFASRADLVLPSTAPFEKSSSFLSIRGDNLFASFALSPLKEVRSDWLIFSSFFFVFEEILALTNSFSVSFLSFRFFDVLELRKYFAFLFYSVPSLVNLGFYQEKFQINQRKLRIWNSVLMPLYDSYYTSDYLTKSSKVASLAYLRFKPKGLFR